VNFKQDLPRVDREFRKLKLQIYLRCYVKYDYCRADVHKPVLVVILLYVNNSRKEIHENPTDVLVADARFQKEDRRMDEHGLCEVLPAPYRKITSQFQCKVTNI
jgi:hypothetical protein